MNDNTLLTAVLSYAVVMLGCRADQPDMSPPSNRVVPELCLTINLSMLVTREKALFLKVSLCSALSTFAASDGISAVWSLGSLLRCCVTFRYQPYLALSFYSSFVKLQMQHFLLLLQGKLFAVRRKADE